MVIDTAVVVFFISNHHKGHWTLKWTLKSLRFQLKNIAYFQTKTCIQYGKNKIHFHWTQVSLFNSSHSLIHPIHHFCFHFPRCSTLKVFHAGREDHLFKKAFNVKHLSRKCWFLTDKKAEAWIKTCDTFTVRIRGSKVGVSTVKLLCCR